MNIFDLVQSKEIASYWNTAQENTQAYLGEELFPSNKKLGLDLKWLKGSKGLPVVLKLAAFDSKAVPRSRIGVDKISSEMPFFKESMYIDEELRQELNKVIETANEAYINSIVARIFDDEQTLLVGAAAARERMRMMLLTTGTIAMSSNGQSYTYDYGLTSEQKPTVSKSWSDPTADIIEDIKKYQAEREDETGIKPTRAVCSRKTMGYLTSNNGIRSAIWGVNNQAAINAPISTAKVQQYLAEECDLDVIVYSKKYKDESGKTMPFVADDTFVMFPDGVLGNTWFGTTPEESDLMGSAGVDNVSIVDTGVAITTMKKADPVNVETKVTQITLPSFEAANGVVIVDVIV